ncbi:hypothetical protein T07_8778 [Trichinella nelsoni]|uniref:Uncharacterized protein n=1 Tax=Trichinella nelsoni TaxID=6336 RepID=A0A0V0RPP1_9BILA|nr:hypothetical protein T07_8778 [Trichinella nelsoni]
MKKTPSSSLDVNHPLAQKRQRRHLNVQVEVKNIGSPPQYRTLSLLAKSSKEARIDRLNVAWRFGSAENSEEHHNLSESRYFVQQLVTCIVGVVTSVSGRQFCESAVGGLSNSFELFVVTVGCTLFWVRFLHFCDSLVTTTFTTCHSLRFIYPARAVRKFLCGISGGCFLVTAPDPWNEGTFRIDMISGQGFLLPVYCIFFRVVK